VVIAKTSNLMYRFNVEAHMMRWCKSLGLSRTIVFWRQQSLVHDPSSPEICAQNDPTPFRTPQLRPISAHSASTVRAGEKVQLTLIASRPRAFQWAIDEPCTLTLRPPEDGTKRDFAVFASKIQILSIEVCYKVTLCENFQRQSCSYIIPLSNAA